jgi:hypothetical protein
LHDFGWPSTEKPAPTVRPHSRGKPDHDKPAYINGHRVLVGRNLSFSAAADAGCKRCGRVDWGAVQSAEGIEVGEVSSVTMNKDGQVSEIRMNLEQSLGIGEKTVILPQGHYLVLRGTVVLQLPLKKYPTASGHRE